MNNALTIASPGVTVVSAATSASVALPTYANGSPARYCRLSCTGYLYVKFGIGTVTATTSDILLSPNTPAIFATRQFTALAYLQETAGAKLNVVPVES
ncbi:MAG TPA: hypothetical protein VHL08_04605 [Dongiaceae bacterium]|jgi:hypothetical protein|nr:hypothetical protein [Dongiaceae bacterium]